MCIQIDTTCFDYEFYFLFPMIWRISYMCVTNFKNISIFLYCCARFVCSPSHIYENLFHVLLFSLDKYLAICCVLHSHFLCVFINKCILFHIFKSKNIKWTLGQVSYHCNSNSKNNGVTSFSWKITYVSLLIDFYLFDSFSIRQ